MAGSRIFSNRYRHDANGSRAGDQHVFTDQIERKGRVRRVAQRVENRRHVVADRHRQFEHIEGGYRQVFGERARPVDADADRIHAQMPAAGPAVATDATGDVSFSRDPVTDFEAFDLAAALDDLAAEFMADVHRHRDRVLRPLVPLEDVDVGTADRGPPNLDQHVVVADLRHSDVFHPYAALGLSFNQCFHQVMTPSSCPTSAKAATA